MVDKLDLLERELRILIESSGEAAHETTMDRRLADRRLNVERRWQGQLRWIYVTAVEADLSDACGEYALFLGWYSDPPGEIFWEGRCLGDLSHTKELVSLWLQGAAPETLPSTK